MDWDTFTKITEENMERRAKLLMSKGQDYDKSEDRLSSFKEVAAILNALHSDGHADHTPVGVADTLLALKLVRDANLRLKGGDPLNESRQDTNDDTHNYLDLRTGLEVEAMPPQQFNISVCGTAMAGGGTCIMAANHIGGHSDAQG